MHIHKKQTFIYIGVDVHKNSHTAVIINCWKEKLGEMTFGNSTREFKKLLDYVKTLTVDGLSPIYGLEDVHGLGRLLSRYLREKKKPVKYVNSCLSHDVARKQTALHKSDPYDAWCVAQVLLDKLDDLPDANTKDDIYYMINQLVTRRESVVNELIILKNQLHAQLTYHYPSYHKFFYKIDTKSALAFWHKYPSYYELEHVTVEELGEFFHSTTRGKLSLDKAIQIRDIIQHDGFVYVNETRNFLIRSYVDSIHSRNDELDDIDKRLEELVSSLDYKLTTILGISYVQAGKLIAEIGDIERFASASKLAKYSGIAPVQYSSGEKSTSYRNKRGNRKLNSTIFRLSLIQLQVNSKTKEPYNKAFYEYYHKKLREGKTKRQAITCISRRLVNIIYRMMRDKTEYIMPT